MEQLVRFTPIPKPGQRLMRKIVTACKGQDSDHVVNALFNVLLQAIEQWEDCEAAEAAKYIRDAAEHAMLLEQEDKEVGHA
jgi:hypothetical protein